MLCEVQCDLVLDALDVDTIKFFFSLAACGGNEFQAEPTPTPVSSSTPSPVLTSTLEPTNTPLSTNSPLPPATPSPVPTVTITSTPTPRIGDTRVNPETDEEEVFSSGGEWARAYEDGDWRMNDDDKLEAYNTNTGWVEVQDPVLVDPVEELDHSGDQSLNDYPQLRQQLVQMNGFGKTGLPAYVDADQYGDQEKYLFENIPPEK